jgi:hypothetical protein
VLRGGDLTGANLTGLDLRCIAAALSKRVEIRFVTAPREHLAAGAIDSPDQSALLGGA